MNDYETGKTTPKKVKEVYNRMIVFDSGREKKQRFKKNYQLITLDFISKEHEFGYEEVCEMFKIIKKMNWWRFFDHFII